MTDDPSRPPALGPPSPPPLANGVPQHPGDHDQPQLPNGAPPTPSQTAVLPKGLANALQELPSQVPDLEHITEGYQPLSKLFERAAQECFNNLKETIANAQDAARPRMVNGTANGAEHQAASTAKRSQWLQFANNNRERFIKLLVLLQWSKQAREDVGQLVDVVSWMRQLSESYIELEDSVGLFKRDMSSIKIPRPDIDTALEVLTTGQSSQMPDLSYLPRPPISSRQILDTLNNIDTLLHIRLNVHETLPPQLRNFKISSGRVTFVVDGEFELDLSIFDEDPSTHFYFLDFRFLFSPCSDVPSGALREELERRANSVLASEGLTSCYEMFHDFTLTYKLSVLRRQVIDLARGAWTGALRVERVHRSLVIQYWIGTAQKKNWIEIGIQSGQKREGAHSWKGDEPSHLSLKWFRSGKQVLNGPPIRLDAEHLNVERILETVARRHALHLIGAARNEFKKIPDLDISSSSHTDSLEDEDDPYLTIPLYVKGSSTLRIEPISGRFTLSPKTPSSTRCENSLNKLQNPEDELFAKLQAWRAYDGAATLRESVGRCGWEMLSPVSLEASARRKYFGGSSVGQTFFKRWSHPKWVVAATPNSVVSFSLLILNIEEEPTNQTLWRTEGARVRSAFTVDGNAREFSADYCERLYADSIAIISSHIIRKRLSELGVPFSNPLPNTRSSKLAFAPLMLDVSKTIAPLTIAGPLFIYHHGLKPVSKSDSIASGNIVHVASGVLKVANESTLSLLTKIKSRQIGFKSDGTFVILDRSPAFAPEVVENLLRELRHIVQLQSCIEYLQHYGLRIVSVTLKSLTFAYVHGSRLLQGRLVWSPSGSVSLECAPKDNPHIRVLPMFRSMLQRTSNSKAPVFRTFSRTLLFTFNLLVAFDKIESRGGAIVETYRLEKYNVIYDHPRCVISITARCTQDQSWRQSWWYIQQADHSPGANAKLQAELKAFMSEGGDGIIAMNKGVATTYGNVGNVLGRLDERIRACADGEEKRPKRPRNEGGSGNPPAPAEADTSAKTDGKTQEKPQPNSQQQKQQQQNSKAQGQGANETASTNGTTNGAKVSIKPEVVVLD